MSLLLRFVIGLLTACLIAAAANYYLGMGWFGDYAQLVMTSLMLLNFFIIGLTIRLYRDRNKG